MLVSSTAPTAADGAYPTGAHLVADLTPAQRRAVETPSTMVCVLASAGAGKTRVLTRRVAYRLLTGTAGAGHALAITFTRKAAGELTGRLSELGLAGPVAAGTFHSVAFSQLRRWWADRRTPEPALLHRKGRLLAELVQARPALRDVPVAELASELEWAKARLVSPAGFAEAAGCAHRELPADAEAIAALYARYEDEKRRRRLVDFDDLLGRYADALGADSRFAAAQRWKWRHIFVDELQDVNPLQCRLLLALLGENQDLFVVGDPNQAIYGWNGADPGFLADLPRRWPAAEVVHLDDNHRSSPQVVAAAAAVLGRQASGDMRSSRPDGPLPSLRSFPSESAEAAGVAAEVRAARARGIPWEAMAVLARTNAQLSLVAKACGQAEVPFRALAASEEAEDMAAPEPLELLEGDSAPRPARGRVLQGEAGHVTLCSFHRAKGLQWRAVWVCGLEAGFVPIAYASSSGALAEERRLLYVALTRAEVELHCSWARERRAGNGAALPRAPSPWLPALAAYCSGVDGGHGLTAPGGLSPGADGPVAARRDAALLDFLAMARKRLSKAKASTGTRHGHPEGYGAPEVVSQDPTGAAVAEALRQWRRRLARASGVPPHVLMHDATIEAIAARRPESSEELLAVPGMGPVKVSRYGLAVLEVVRESSGAPPAPDGVSNQSPRAVAVTRAI